METEDIKQAELRNIFYSYRLGATPEFWAAPLSQITTIGSPTLIFSSRAAEDDWTEISRNPALPQIKKGSPGRTDASL